MANDSVVVQLLSEIHQTGDPDRRAALQAVIAVVRSGSLPEAQWEERAVARAGPSAAVREHIQDICGRLNRAG